jgi:SSS family solute:Na+ symporter
MPSGWPSRPTNGWRRHLLIVGKWFLPVFLRNGIYTMPQFLEQRYGGRIRTLMAVFWLGLYVFVNLSPRSCGWAAIAVTQVTGMDQMLALVLIGVFALLYQLYGGLKAVALTDIVQVSLLVLGGLLVAALTLDQIGGDGGASAASSAVGRASRAFPDDPRKDNPFYKDLPGLSVLIGGMWIMNISYWGFNQYIIQRALAARTSPRRRRACCSPPSSSC